MAFDFKKEYKEFYMPKNKPEIVTVPKANYIAVRGKGNPNEEGGEYKQAVGILYAIAYTLKMSYKSDYKIEGFLEYVVPPLEGFWWQDGPFDDEPSTVAIMDKFLEENGYRNDFSAGRLHHEIYMSDARKIAPCNWKTVIRHPICKLQGKG